MTYHQLFSDYGEAYLDTKYRYVDPDGRKYRLDNLTGPGGAANGNPSYEVFGVTRFWRYSRKRMDELVESGRIVQTRPGGVPQLKRYLDEMAGIAIGDDWGDIRPINSQAAERLGYPTQKPVALLERILSASTNPGDVVLDPFCGCGTSTHAAQKLGRRWIGIDITHLAISLIERRLKDAFPGIAFDVYGTPKDMEGARDLARRDKYQFQWWALSLVEAQPFAGKKKGADGGIDGLIYFRSDAKTTERAVVSVKGGDNVGVPMVRDLKGVLDREKAPIGVFLTLVPPTRPMEAEAAAAGFYTLGDRQYARIQIITIAQALSGKKPAIPLVDTGAAFRRAVREDTGSQTKFNL
jgi:site-specific DNA-methyltransferase (adenine-specific)